jgi:hypothetical protein
MSFYEKAKRQAENLGIIAAAPGLESLFDNFFHKGLIPKITLFCYRGNEKKFQRLSGVEYQAKRAHPERPIQALPLSYKEDLIHADELRCEKILGNRDFCFEDQQRLKFIGWDQDADPLRAMTIGTSQKNLPCISDNFAGCIGVAIGISVIDRETGKAKEGMTKVRLFHVYDTQEATMRQIDYCLKEMQKTKKNEKEELHIAAACYGGTSSEFSMNNAEKITDLLVYEHNVGIVFNETCAKRRSYGAFGIVIEKDNSFRFITNIYQRPIIERKERNTRENASDEKTSVVRESR